MAECFNPLSPTMTMRQLGWRKLFLILAVLPCCTSIQVTIENPKYEVARGGDITLTCFFTPAREFTSLVLTWSIDPNVPGQPTKSVATYFTNNPIGIAPAYEGRASLEVDLAAHVSKLTITKVTMQDSQYFQCTVIIPNDDEGQTSANTFLLVLVPPSVPICKIQGRAEYGHNISLTCMSEEGSPKPTYDWTSVSVDNVPRTLPPKAFQKDGVLSLFNISRETSGFYICTATNRIDSARCNFTLAVMPASMNEASIPIIIGGVLAGLLVLGILIFCYCRKKGKKDKYAEGAPADMEFYDRDAPEAGEQYQDDQPNSETKQHKQYEDKDSVPLNDYSVGTSVMKFEDDQHSHGSGKERNEGKGSEVDSQRDRLDGQRDRYGGSRDQLDDQRNRYTGSREHLDDRRDRYGGSRDRLDDQPNRYGGSHDRLDDQRNRYGGSHDRLDDQPNRYGGSHNRLDDQRNRYGGSREHLDDRRDRYGGSRDRLDDQPNRYGGSRDRLDDQPNRYGGSREHLDDRRDRYGGSRDRLN